MSEQVVIVGAGQAGFQVAASLREGGFGGRILLLGEEPGLPYQRPPLSKAYLTGAMSADGLLLRRERFYAEQRIELRPSTRVAAIDRTTARVELADGARLAYDHLVLATGARDRPLPVPGADLQGVMRLRRRDEADALRPRMAEARQIVVIGAGFIGLEFAAVARQTGAAVHLIEMAGRPLSRSVSAEVSAFFHAAHAGWGSSILLGTALARLVGQDGRVRAVETADGLTLPADLVLVGIGVRPATELAEAAGLAIADGIRVDETLRTADPLISAIGDCAAYPSPFADGGLVRLESVQNAVDQGRCVAARLAGHARAYRSVPWFWSDQGNLRLQIVGLTGGHDTSVVRGTPASGSFSVFCFKADHLLGIESVNRPGDHMAGRRLLAAEEPGLTPEAAADPSLDLKALAAALPRQRAR
jgi:3-phenylpropionate/trans-cinnamate dioxygenase ferredoxin reductase subunit